MNREEYEREVKQTLADLCLAALSGMPGMEDGDAAATITTELIIAAAKMMSVHNEKMQRDTAQRFYTMMQDFALMNEVMLALKIARKGGDDEAA